MSVKQLPCDLAAEKAVLGSCLLERDAIIAIEPWLPSDYFYLQKHSWIYEAICACYKRLVPPDLTTVSDELRRHERLDKIGGIFFLTELMEVVPSALHVDYYAKIVERCALQRSLIEVGGKITSYGYDESQDLQTILHTAETALYAVSRSARNRESKFVPIAEGMHKIFTEMARAANGEGTSSIPSGYMDLDEVLGSGFRRADLIILAGRPSLGKTSMALCLAYNMARFGHRVGFFSLEMGLESLCYRLTAIHTDIDTQKMRSWKVTDEEASILARAGGYISSLPIVVDPTPQTSIQEMMHRARQEHMKQPLDVIFMDYLQLAEGKRGKESNRVQEVGQISRGLKAMAKELDIPVIALSQLSRAVEGRTSHIPILSDLRDSGEIEQDADLVTFVYREEIYDKETDKKGIAELHIAKHRDGPVGVVPFRWVPHVTRFEDLERYRAPNGY